MLAKFGMPRNSLSPWRHFTRESLFSQLSSSFRYVSNIRQGVPISSLLFDFLMDEILRSAMIGSANLGVESRPRDKLSDLEYADSNRLCLPFWLKRLGMVYSLH